MQALGFPCCFGATGPAEAARWGCRISCRTRPTARGPARCAGAARGRFPGTPAPRWALLAQLCHTRAQVECESIVGSCRTRSEGLNRGVFPLACGGTAAHPVRYKAGAAPGARGVQGPSAASQTNLGWQNQNKLGQAVCGEFTVLSDVPGKTIFLFDRGQPDEKGKSLPLQRKESGNSHVVPFSSRAPKQQ